MTIEKGKRKCPNCTKGYLDTRTPRPLWMKATLFYLPIRRFKCSYCNKKAYVYGATDTDSKQEASKLQSA